MSVSYSQDKQYTGQVYNEVPDQISINPLVKPLSCASRIVSFQTQSADANAGSISLINITGGPNSFLKANSAYLSFQLAVTMGTTGGSFSFGNNTQSASSLIRRISITAPGTQAENLQFYNQVQPMILLGRTNNNYIVNVSAAMEGSTIAQLAAVGAGAAAPVVTISCAVPVIAGVWCGDAHYPLGLFGSASTLLSIDWESNLALALQSSSSTATISGYTVKNLKLVYEVLEVDVNYMNSVKQRLAGGELYSICATSFVAYPFSIPSGSITQSFTFGTVLESLLGVNWTLAASPTGFAATVVGQVYSARSQTNVQLFVDGIQYNTAAIADTTTNAPYVFAEAQRSFRALGDPELSWGVNPNAATGATVLANSQSSAYLGSDFVAGNSLRKFDLKSPGFSMEGVKCSYIQLTWSGTPVAADTFLVLLNFSEVFTVDGNGMMTRHI